MDTNTKASALSRNDIRCITNKIKKIFSIPTDKAFPILRFMEYCFPRLKLNYEIVDDNEIKGSYAEAIPAKQLLRISLSTYNGARNGNPRDKFTIAHEIGHLILHTPNYISFARNHEYIPKYRCPEWQANTFAGELLVHTDIIKGLPPQEIAQRYEVSYTVAQIQSQKA